MKNKLTSTLLWLSSALVALSALGLVSTGTATAATTGSTYTAISPVRILDTRTNGENLGPNSNLTVQVAGTAYVPSNATAVTMNVTVTDTTASSYLSLFPAGGSVPNVSNLNWVAGETLANLATVPVGSSGDITIHNNSGTAAVILDLQGYFVSGGTTGFYIPLTPARIADTRPNSGEPYANQPLGSQQSLNIQVAGVGGVPTSGVAAAVLNVTVTDTTANSFLSVYPAGESNPGTSTLNWGAGSTVANRVVVPLGTNGQITVYNYSGTTDVVVDVSGYFATANTPSGASLYYPITPTRILDTRVSGATPSAGSTLTEQAGNLAGIPATASAVTMNLTATNTTSPSFFNVTPAPSSPTTSDLNWLAGQTIANLDLAPLGANGNLYLYNSQGYADAVIDVFGYFQPVAAATNNAPVACSGTTVSAASSVNMGSGLTVTAAASCPTTGYYTYWYKAPGAPRWSLAQNATTSTTYTYSTSSWSGGAYQIMVWASTQSGVFQQQYASRTVSVIPPPCSNEHVSVSPNPAIVSDPIVISASAACSSQPYYAYFARDNNDTSSYTLIQGWTTNANYLTGTQGWNSGNYSFIVWVSTTPSGSPLTQASAGDALNSSGAFGVSGVTYSSQIYSMNCEETSLQMALTHEGIYIDGNTASTQNAILAAEGVNSSVPGIGPDYPSGNPMSNFIGPPNGGESSTYEPGAYYGAIVKAANHFGGHVLAAGEGISPTQVFRYIEENHPVVVWVTFDWQHYTASWYRDNAGQEIPWAGPHEHSVLVIGVGVNAVLIDNPWPSDTFGAEYAGQNVWVPMSTFESVYSTFNDMAVVLN